MGRQKDRARRRRDQRARAGTRTTPPTDGGGRAWLLFAAAAVAVGIVAVLVVIGIAHRNQSPAASALTATAAPAPPFEAGTIIDGIPCTAEMLTYHVHAHLTILDAGRHITVPANTGISYPKECLYWLHTHDDSGIIHVEAPHKVHLHLGNFFDIWGQPLSRTRVATGSVQAGQSMVIWTNGRKYTGNPRDIPLAPHEDITIEIGPPFPKPKPYNFNGL